MALLFGWFANSFCFYGVIYSTPTLIAEAQSLANNEKNDFNAAILLMIFMSGALLVSTFISYFLVYANKVSSKALIFLSFFLGFAFNLVAAMLGNISSIFFASLGVFFLGLVSNELLSLTLKLASNSNYSISVYSEVSARLGACTMPWLVFIGLQTPPAGMMYAFAAFSLLASFTSLALPSK